MTIEELRLAIESYPSHLAKAMQDVAKAEQAIEKLEEQIAEEEAELAPTPPPVNEQTEMPLDEQRVRFDHEIALLELHCEKTRSEIELSYRRNPPHGDKVTEATVTAFVRSHLQYITAKEKCLEKKLERDMAFRVGIATQRAAQTEQPHEITSPKLIKLREKLFTAQTNLEIAEMRLEEVKASLVPYQLLTQLYTAGLMKA